MFYIQNLSLCESQAIKLYERCLIPCANYTEFWFRYVDFVESKGGRELANFALARASQTFVKVNGITIALVYPKKMGNEQLRSYIIRLLPFLCSL